MNLPARPQMLTDFLGDLILRSDNLRGIRPPFDDEALHKTTVEMRPGDKPGVRGIVYIPLRLKILALIDLEGTPRLPPAGEVRHHVHLKLVEHRTSKGVGEQWQLLGPASAELRSFLEARGGSNKLRCRISLLKTQSGRPFHRPYFYPYDEEATP